VPILLNINLTVTVPADLKREMDEFSRRHPSTNWSLVARNAFKQYIEVLKAPAPQVKISQDGTELKVTGDTGPVLKTLLVFRSQMPTEVTFDRYSMTQTLLTGIDKFLASRAAWRMAPIRVPPNGQIVIADTFPMSPQDLLATDALVTGGLTVKSSIEAYATGFSDPVRTEIIDRLPQEYWADFMEGVRHAYPHIAKQKVGTGITP
jgi:hypothetical protein